ATDEPLASMVALNSPSAAVSSIRDGHLLRWIKQMALRGRSRHFDQDGVCGAQNLVLTGDEELMLVNQQRIFPGSLPMTREHREDRKRTWLLKLLDVLATPDLPSPLLASEVGRRLNTSWPKISRDLKDHPRFDVAVRGLGWRYISRRGQKGSYFERTESTTIDKDDQPQTQPPVYATQLQEDTERDTANVSGLSTEQSSLIEALRAQQRRLLAAIRSSGQDLSSVFKDKAGS